MVKLQAKSFTFRIPAEVDEAFRQQVEERDRGRFLVSLLRQFLGFEKESAQKNIDSSLVARIDKLSHEIELIRTEQDVVRQCVADLKRAEETQDNILQRLTKLEESNFRSGSSENVLQTQAESKTEEILKTEDEPDPTNTQVNLLEGVLGLEPEVPLMTSRELLNILRKENPKREWLPSGLLAYRSGTKMNAWHTVGQCKFIYAKEKSEKKIGRLRFEHQWYVVYPAV